MANVFDYLVWRSDVPFTLDPFNEVDSLVFSLLVYTDFDGIVGEDPEDALTISEVSERYFSVHTEEEVKNRQMSIKGSPFMLPLMAGSARFGNIRVTCFENRKDEEEAEQMCAVTFLLEDGSAYAAFRGTDNTIIGWKEDFKFGYMTGTAGQKHAVEYLDRVFSGMNNCTAIRVGGHSKGGNFAVYASAFCEEAIQNRILEVYSNDGPGFVEEVTQQTGYERILPRIISFIPEESIFGLLMHNRFDNRIIKSSRKGILQHDAFSWEVLRNRFVAAEATTDTSRFVDKTLDAWIESLDENQKKEFIDAAFDLMSSPGAETFKELNDDPIRNYPEIWKKLKSMGPEKQDMLSNTIMALVRSGKDALMDNLFEASTEKTAEVILSLKEKWRGLTGKDKQQKEIPAPTDKQKLLPEKDRET